MGQNELADVNEGTDLTAISIRAQLKGKDILLNHPSIGQMLDVSRADTAPLTPMHEARIDAVPAQAQHPTDLVFQPALPLYEEKLKLIQANPITEIWIVGAIGETDFIGGAKTLERCGTILEFNGLLRFKVFKSG